ncbi:PQQ-binding-like beta-propeller repeat protein [Actinoplanes sp. NPDC023801]|uniref:outer membrane protein assembly factor BamB family protein n=1 Tax=Actinoplanes sp. NPDC023801 TaxID=3154595 RepID=UPI0033F39D32
MPANRASLWALAVIVVSMVVGAGAVALTVGGPDHRDTDQIGPDGDGGTVAWTIDTRNGTRDAWVVGGTAVILDGESLLGLNAADGARRWQLPYPGDDITLTVAGGMAVVQRGPDGPVDVIEPATGRVAWSTKDPALMVARQDALYLDSCPDRREPAGSCVTSGRRVTDGTTLWSATNPGFSLRSDVIGGRRPLAPAATAYLPVTTSSGGALLDTASGRVLPGRVEAAGWYLVAAGDTVAATYHDPPRGDQNCTVTVDAVRARTGKPAWKGTLHSGRRADGECHKRLSEGWSGTVMLGSGTDVAAVTRNGRTTLTDLTTGKVRWTTDEPGVPIAGDDRHLLVRDNAETGPVSLLDMTDGRRLWTAPDPGLPGTSASWESAVAGKLVAVMGATGDRPYVLVFDATTGKQLARRGGWLTALGDDWVMVSTGAGAKAGHLKQHMLTF